MYTLGIDLHKDKWYVVMLDDNDEVGTEAYVQNVNLEKIAKQYAGRKPAIKPNRNYYSVYT